VSGVHDHFAGPGHTGDGRASNQATTAAQKSHGHGVSADADRRYLSIALALIVAFMVVEVAVALFSGSLALLSDAGHMLTDAGAIGAALWSIRLAARPATGVWTFGWKRAEILSAAVNGLTLVVVGAMVASEAIRRLIQPPPVAGGPVVTVALLGVVVNLVAAWVLAKANPSRLNVRGAFQHILTDLYGFIATFIAGVVIVVTGFTRADAIASLIVVALMFHAAWGLLRDSGRVLLEAAPVGTDLNAIRDHLGAIEHVIDVHDLHVWTVTSGLPALSAHVVIHDGCFHDGHAPELLDQMQACLVGHFDVEHSTFQFEPASHTAHEHDAHA
jgi:cobalt-zinc-cadmium efflux system protein